MDCDRFCNSLNEAKDTIIQLKAELTKKIQWPDYFAWEREMKKLQAENKRLKEALKNICRSNEIMEARRIAREGLEQVKKTEHNCQ